VKKTTAIVLSCCLFFTVIGHYVIFCIQLTEIKTAMRRELQHAWKDKAIVFVFAKEEIEKLDWEDGHEFRLNNEMYDVISLHEENGKVVIRCIADKKEKALIEAYQKIHRKSTESPGQTSLLKLLSSQFINVDSYFLKKPVKLIEAIFFSYSSALKDCFRKVAELPPANVISLIR